jgi:hypothetical protein
MAPVAPANRPNKPQGKTVIALKKKAVLTISTILGVFVRSGLGPVGKLLRIAIASADVAVARTALSTLVFTTTSGYRSGLSTRWDSVTSSILLVPSSSAVLLSAIASLHRAHGSAVFNGYHG